MRALSDWDCLAVCLACQVYSRVNAQVSPLFQKKLSAILSNKSKTETTKTGVEETKGTKRKAGGKKGKKKQPKTSTKKKESKAKLKKATGAVYLSVRPTARRSTDALSDRFAEKNP